MNKEIDAVLKRINDLDELLWLMRGVAVMHHDRSLITYVGNLEARLGEIFNEIATWKRPE